MLAWKFPRSPGARHPLTSIAVNARPQWLSDDVARGALSVSARRGSVTPIPAEASFASGA